MTPQNKTKNPPDGTANQAARKTSIRTPDRTASRFPAKGIESDSMANTDFFHPVTIKPIRYYEKIRHYKTICLFMVAGLMLLCFSGCAPEKEEKPVTRETALTRLPLSHYPDFSDTWDKKTLTASINQSLVYFSKLPGTREFLFGRDRITNARIKASLETFNEFIEKNPDKKQINAFIQKNYAVYQSTGSNGSTRVLFTGYYEPSLEGSLVQTDEYPYPLYTAPDDLLTLDLAAFSEKFTSEPLRMARIDRQNRVVPYYSRKEINAIKDFHKRAAPLVFLKSRIDRFFLEIQGSGRVNLKQGGILRVHYHTKNGHPYRSIGKYLIDNQKIPREKMSMQSIRAWLKRHPEEVESIFNYNPSFVFFKEQPNGPLGCLGVKVTSMRSIATDTALFPKGALCFIHTFIPHNTKDTDRDTWQKYSGFVLNQDTGGAIKGPGRADFFYGSGKYAEFAAGQMNHPGKLYFLVLKQDL
ncbi:MAG: MltA domain-containing protein [Desulfobacteraceae bacterium]